MARSSTGTTERATSWKNWRLRTRVGLQVGRRLRSFALRPSRVRSRAVIRQQPLSWVRKSLEYLQLSRVVRSLSSCSCSRRTLPRFPLMGERPSLRAKSFGSTSKIDLAALRANGLCRQVSEDKAGIDAVGKADRSTGFEPQRVAAVHSLELICLRLAVRKGSENEHSWHETESAGLVNISNFDGKNSSGGPVFQQQVLAHQAHPDPCLRTNSAPIRRFRAPEARSENRCKYLI